MPGLCPQCGLAAGFGRRIDALSATRQNSRAGGVVAILGGEVVASFGSSANAAVKSRATKA